MSKEQRAVFIGVLITLVYPATLWIEKGILVYPFPLNEFIFFVVSAQVIFLNYKERKSTAFISGLTALFFLLTSPYFWTFFLSDFTISRFLDGGIYEMVKLSYHILLLIWMVHTIIDINGTKKYIVLFVLTSMFLISPIFWLPLIGTSAVIGTAIVASIYQLKKPFNLLWLLLAYLALMKDIFFYFN